MSIPMPAPVTRLAEWAEDASTRFESTLKPQTPRGVLFGLTGLTVALFALFAWLAPRGFELGDGALYAGYIRDASIGYATKHIGYYVLGIIFTRIVPLPIELTLNLMSALFAALTAGLAGIIAHKLTGRWQAAMGAAMCVVLPYTFVTGAVNAEVYVVQAFFLLLCVFFILQDRAILAGIAFAVAFTVTPSSALAVPFLLLLKPRLSFVAKWALAAALLAIAALAPFYRDFLWGPHGVLSMPDANITLAQAIPKEARELWEFGFALPLIALGIHTFATSARHRLFLAGLAAMWLVQLLFGERYSDVPVQFPLYVLLAVVGGVGLARLARGWSDSRLWSAAAALVLAAAMLTAGLTTYTAVAKEADEVDRLHTALTSMIAEADSGDVAVAPFAVRSLGEFYQDAAKAPAWVADEALAGKSGATAQAAAQKSLTDAIAARRRVWLPGDFDQSAFAFFESQGYEVVPFEDMYVAQPAAGS